MAKFKLVTLRNHHVQVDEVMITCEGCKFRIKPTLFGEGMTITKITDDGEDECVISPLATNQIRIR